MKNEIGNNSVLSDVELLAEVKRLTAIERQATSHLIAALGELDAWFSSPGNVVNQLGPTRSR